MLNEKQFFNLYFFIRWSALEDESGMKLVHKTGAVYMGREGTPGGQKIEDMIAATRQAGIP